MSPRDTSIVSSETEWMGAVERAVARALDRGDGAAGERLPSVDRAVRWIGFLATLLEGAGWSVERRGGDLPPRRMAQIAALEVDRRRVVLYIPFLRWIADSFSNGVGQDALGLLSDLPVFGAFVPMTEADRVVWVEAMALTHEFFHALDCDASLRGEFLGPRYDGAWAGATGEAGDGTKRQDSAAGREALEEAAHRFVAVALDLLMNSGHS